MGVVFSSGDASALMTRSAPMLDGRLDCGLLQIRGAQARPCANQRVRGSLFYKREVLGCIIPIAGAASMILSGASFAVETEEAHTAGNGNGLREIVVTAERCTETVQKTGAAISVRGGEDMLQQEKFSLAAILEDVSGISGGNADSVVTSRGGGTDSQAAALTIRGIPSNQGSGGSIASTSPAVAIYVDDVYGG